MPRKHLSPRSPAEDTPPPKPSSPPELPGEGVFDRLDQQLVNAYLRFMTLLDEQPIDRKAKEELASHFNAYSRSLHEPFVLAISMLNEIAEWFYSKSEYYGYQVKSHVKGPRLKHERVQERHAAIDKAVEAGITGDEGLYRFMMEHHPELIRKGKGKLEFISIRQMMRQYREAKRP